MTGMMGAPAPLPTTPIAQAANSLVDLLAVLADPEKAATLIESIKAETSEHERTRLAAQQALAAANARHADADERDQLFERIQADAAEAARAREAAASSRESAAMGVQGAARTAAAEADTKIQRLQTLESASKTRSDELTRRENAVAARENAVTQREQKAEELIAQYTGKLESFRRIAVG